jgi:Asp-tRNA(Asn)/Glu-tRNA(Gln) amidotransferase A subunit family amidase
MTGLPALVLPCGFSSGPPRLPIGLQIYGRAFDEATVLRVGHAFERATPWHREKPVL